MIFSTFFDFFARAAPYGRFLSTAICYNRNRGLKTGGMETKDGLTKRVIIIYVLNILKLYSSPFTPVTQSAVCNYLNDVGI